MKSHNFWTMNIDSSRPLVDFRRYIPVLSVTVTQWQIRVLLDELASQCSTSSVATVYHRACISSACVWLIRWSASSTPDGLRWCCTWGCGLWPGPLSLLPSSWDARGELLLQGFLTAVPIYIQDPILVIAVLVDALEPGGLDHKLKPSWLQT